MSQPPTVSVVLPTYKRMHLVRRAVHSALWQTFGDLEVIVVDDASPDVTAEVVRQVDDPRLRYVRHETNRGLAAARNTGIAHARGAYIAFLDDDDLWLPDKLEKQLRCFEQSAPSVGAVHCGFLRWQAMPPYRGVVPTGPSELQGHALFKLLIRKAFTQPSALVVKRCVVDEIGLFDEAFVRVEDTDFILRIATRYEFGFVPENLLLYYELPGSLVTDKFLMLSMLEKLTRKHRSLYEQHPGLYAQTLAWLGGQYRVLGELTKARELVAEALCRDRRSVLARRIARRIRYRRLWGLASRTKAVLRSVATSRVGRGGTPWP